MSVFVIYLILINFSKYLIYNFIFVLLTYFSLKYYISVGDRSEKDIESSLV